MMDFESGGKEVMSPKESEDIHVHKTEACGGVCCLRAIMGGRNDGDIQRVRKWGQVLF